MLFSPLNDAEAGPVAISEKWRMPKNRLASQDEDHHIETGLRNRPLWNRCFSALSMMPKQGLWRSRKSGACLKTGLLRRTRITTSKRAYAIGLCGIDAFQPSQ